MGKRRKASEKHGGSGTRGGKNVIAQTDTFTQPLKLPWEKRTGCYKGSEKVRQGYGGIRVRNEEGGKVSKRKSKITCR